MSSHFNGDFIHIQPTNYPLAHCWFGRNPAGGSEVGGFLAGNLWIGGTAPSSAPFKVDSTGQLTIKNVGNGITTTLDNSSSVGSGRASGLSVTDGTFFGQVDKLGLYAYQSGTSNAVACSVVSSGGYVTGSGASGRSFLLDASVGPRLVFNNTQVLTVRQTGPGNTTDSSDVATRFNALLAVLRTHGLIT